MRCLNLLALCLMLFCFVGCAAETPTAVDSDPEVPEAAPEEKFQVLLETTKGNITMEVHPEWSPKGAARFKELVELGFYDNCAFFRVLENFMAQVGINGDPELHAKWRLNSIPDDPVAQSNKRGYVSFATGGPNTRSTQFFINYGDNSQLDAMGFSPFAQVLEGMDVVDSLYKDYGEGAPRGRGPDQKRLSTEGNSYLKKEFPMLDYIKKATLIKDSAKEGAKAEAVTPAVKEEKKPAAPAAEKKEDTQAKPEKKPAEKASAKKTADTKEPVKKEPVKKEN